METLTNYEIAARIAAEHYQCTKTAQSEYNGYRFAHFTRDDGTNPISYRYNDHVLKIWNDAATIGAHKTEPAYHIHMTGDTATIRPEVHSPQSIAALAHLDRLTNGRIVQAIAEHIEDYNAAPLIDAITNQNAEHNPAAAALFSQWQAMAEQLNELKRNLRDQVQTEIREYENARAFQWPDRQALAVESIARVVADLAA